MDSYARRTTSLAASGGGADRPAAPSAASLGEELAQLRQDVVDFAAGPGFPAPAGDDGGLTDARQPATTSLRNLAHYLGLRRHDRRSLQRALARLGLSSLGRCEGHVLATLDAVGDALAALAGPPAVPGPDARTPPPPIGIDEATQRLAANTGALFGPPAVSETRIMVTMPTEAATDPTLVGALVRAGMTCARINCAHDGPDQWAAMIANVRAAGVDAGRACRVLMDLAGPKLRTGTLPDLPGVVKVKPQRDDYGLATRPGRVLLVPRAGHQASPGGEARNHQSPADRHPSVPVPGDWAVRRRIGDRVALRDARGSRRHLELVEPLGDAWVAATEKTTYLVEGTELRVGSDAACIGALPPRPGWLGLGEGDRLVVTSERSPGAPAVRDPDGAVLEPARLSCTLEEIFAAVRAGDPIWFDDGRLGGTVVETGPEAFTVDIHWSGGRSRKLRAGKGVNLPRTELSVSALTAKDLADLAFAAEHADAVGLSFVRSPADVALLRRHLSALHAGQLGVVLKIENDAAFRRLPELLVAALSGADPDAPPSSATGVMIARGDLAVEVGWERLAEVQEEILWLCEAAHVPTVWATEVLDDLARSGQPSRAEITDAAMAARAEAVMLNKGPHIVEAVTALADILGRMEAHQHKKQFLFRQLRAWYGP